MAVSPARLRRSAVDGYTERQPLPAVRQPRGPRRARPCRGGARLSRGSRLSGGSTCQPSGCPPSRNGREIFSNGRRRAIRCSRATTSCRAPGTATTWPSDSISRAAEARAGSRSSRFVRGRPESTCASGSARIALSNGETLEADRVLLALGNSPAAGDAPQRAAGRRRRLGPALDGQAADLRAARAAGRHGADDDRPGARDRGAAARRARHGDLAARPPAAAARGASTRPAAKFDATAMLARGPLSQRLHALPCAGHGLRRRLAQRAAAGAHGHAGALARGAAPAAPALPAAPARVLGRASPPRAARDVAADRFAAREEPA